jgi:hypothetical protein
MIFAGHTGEVITYAFALKTLAVMPLVLPCQFILRCTVADYPAGALEPEVKVLSSHL